MLFRSGNEEKVDAILELLRPFGIKEVVRTGTIALSRKSELNLKGSKEAPEAKDGKPEKKTTGKKK